MNASSFDENMYVVDKNTKILLYASKCVDLEKNREKTKYMC